MNELQAVRDARSTLDLIRAIEALGGPLAEAIKVWKERREAAFRRWKVLRLETRRARDAQRWDDTERMAVEAADLAQAWGFDVPR